MRSVVSRIFSYICIVKILLVAFVAAWWFIAEPSHNRNWSPEYALLPHIQWQSTSTVHIANIRDWYFTNTSIPTEQTYRNETIDLNTLKKTWFFIEPFSTWSGIGHTFFSFEFTDGRSIILSVEARKEVGEEYSGFRSLFPTYEYMYVLTTERDMLTNTVYFAEDDVYRYPLTIPLEDQKELLRVLLESTAALVDEPRYYHLFGANCTNILARHANRAHPESVPLHYSWFLTGYADSYLYDLGYIPHDIPFAEMERQALLTPLIRSAIAAGTGSSSPAFSSYIRQ
jgi:hypothetical protein